MGVRVYKACTIALGVVRLNQPELLTTDSQGDYKGSSERKEFFVYKKTAWWSWRELNPYPSDASKFCVVERLTTGLLSKEKEIDKDRKENTSAKQPGHYRSFEKIANASHRMRVNSIFHTPLIKKFRQGNGPLRTCDQ